MVEASQESVPSRRRRTCCRVPTTSAERTFWVLPVWSPLSLRINSDPIPCVPTNVMYTVDVVAVIVLTVTVYESNPDEAAQATALELLISPEFVHRTRSVVP